MIVGRTYSKRRMWLEAATIGLFIIAGVIFDRQFSNDVVTVAVRGLLSVSLCFALLFVWNYSHYPWRMTVTGRALMTLQVTIGVVLLTAVSAWAFGDYRGRDAVSIVAYTLVTWSMWRLLWMLRPSLRTMGTARRLSTEGKRHDG